MTMKLLILKKAKKFNKNKLIMKIKSIISKHKNKLIELQILKFKIYKNNIEKKKIEHNKIKLYFKKIAHIIYEYHINNKVILFVNFPSELENNINSLKKNIKHIFISKENLVNGFLTNKSVDIYSKLIQSSKESKFSNKKKFFDLIVIFNPNDDYVLNESYKLHIPTIFITNELLNNVTILSKQSYKIIGCLKFIEEQINNNFLFSILQAIFKQAVIRKKIKQHQNRNNKFSLKKKKIFKKYKHKNYIYKKNNTQH